MPTGDRVLDWLDARGVAYEVIPVDPALADTAAFCAHYGYPLSQSVNAILVASKKTPPVVAMAVLLATTRLDVNKVMRKLMGVPRASFAPPEQTREMTGMEIGGVTPFALPEELVVYVDRAVMAPDWVIVGGGGRDRKLRLAPSALLVVPRAEVVDGLANPIATGSSA